MVAVESERRRLARDLHDGVVQELLYVPGDQVAEGAELLNQEGERFMTRYEPAGELASRDLVSRAIVREQGRTGGPVSDDRRGLVKCADQILAGRQVDRGFAADRGIHHRQQRRWLQCC